MTQFTLNVRNSFCSFSENIPNDISNLVKQVLTYRNDIGAEKNSLLGKMNYAKRVGNKQLYNASLGRLKQLEKEEWVCWFQNNSFPTGHLNIILDLLNELKCNFLIKDYREKPEPYLILPWNNKPHQMRYYQEEMVEKGLQAGRGVFEAAVGSGKSLVLTYLIKKLAVNSLIIVPSRGLLQQLFVDLELYFGFSKVQILDTGKVRKSSKLKPIRLMTVQSLASLQKTSELSNVISDVDAVFIDEFHHSGSSSYTNLLPEIENIYYRFGFTGTFLRNDSKSLDMWGFLSTRLYSYPAWKATQEGFLTPLKVISYELWGKSSRSYQMEYDKNYCGGQELLDKILEICQSIKKGESVLILVNKKDKSGKIIQEFLNLQGFSSQFISGDDSKEHINKTIENFNDKNIDILIGSSVIGEGIDIRATDHLIMCQGGKSEIVVVQAVGRVARLYPGKSNAVVHDFKFSNTKYLEKHYQKRMEIYEKNFNPEFQEE